MASKNALVEYVDTKRAAEFLGLAPGTLQNQRSLRAGPPYIRLSPKRIIYKLADLRAYLEARRIDPERD